MNYSEIQEFNKLEENLETVRQQGIAELQAYGVEMQDDDGIKDVVDAISKIKCVKNITVQDNVITVVKNDNTTVQYTVKDTTYSAATNELGLMKTGGDLTIVDGVGYVNDNSHEHTIENVTELQTTLDGKAESEHTHSKQDITDFPTIPTKLSQLENDSGYTTGDYTLPAATSTMLGGVKTGSNITNTNGTISLTKANVTAALGYTPPTTNTTYSVATQSSNGLMSAADKKKLDGLGNKAPFVVSSSAPSDTSLFWIDGGVLKYYNGSQWVACVAALG